MEILPVRRPPAGGQYAERGGGICNWCDSLRLSNCTFTGNSADMGGAVRCIGPGNTMVAKCILWGDEPVQGREIALENCEDEDKGILYPSEVSIEHSGVNDVNAAAGCTVHWGEGNIALDPAFAGADWNDYHLKSQAGRVWEGSVIIL